MRKLWLLSFILVFGFLTACGNDEAVGEVDDSEELVPLEVDFIVPETVSPGDTVVLEAVVNYGEEQVEDADVLFEYWLEGNEEDSTEISGVHTQKGSYKAEVTFEEPGVYEMYAHTDAKGLHTMPLQSITVE